MNRADYYNYIEERLTTLCLRIERRGRLNILDYNLHAEHLYRDLFNLLFNWKLSNINDFQQNAEAIDLVDVENKIIIQVSATTTKAKIDDALIKIPKGRYNDFTFKFISIAKSAKNIKSKTYTLPQGISFNSQSDIYDVEDILRKIDSLDIESLKRIYDFVYRELGVETPTLRLSSNLTTIINLLSKEDLSNVGIPSLNSFEIERKIEFNQLSNSKALIVEYNIYQGTVARIYSSFDSMGQPKSTFVLGRIRKIYLENQAETNGDALFRLITNNIKHIITNSANFDTMSEDEIDLCVDILVVDAFIRCKIFENPENYNYATT